MRQSGSEKLETIRVVEDSELSVTATLRELVFQLDHVLHRTMVALDLPLSHGMVRRPARVLHPVLPKILF